MTELVQFIDNAEDRIVVEIDAEWAEGRFMNDVYMEGYEQPVDKVWNHRLMEHLGLGINWGSSKVEYTGETYIVTFERLWM